MNYRTVGSVVMKTMRRLKGDSDWVMTYESLRKRIETMRNENPRSQYES